VSGPMAAEIALPAWADELKRRYVRGESSVFVLFGNVHDKVLHGGKLLGVSDFLAQAVLEKKDIIARYNVSAGCRLVKKPPGLAGHEEMLLHRSTDKVLPGLERMLFTENNVGVVIDYAEMVSPAGDPSFFSETDRLALVTLQRWSIAPQLEGSDNIVLLLCEVPSELNPKIVANPRVAAVQVPMPTIDERRAAIRFINPSLEADWIERLADITAGLKIVQICGILRPPPPAAEDAESRFRYIKGLVGDEKRARRLASVTQGMAREEIHELVGVQATAAATAAAASDEKREEHDAVLDLIGKRKREIIERECFGLIEFVTPKHDFSLVGGIDEIKKELSLIARNIREGRTARVPMGLLFTGPMGTGKTFVAEAFAKESGLTTIKLKSFRSKWVGATESNLERILNVVQAIGNVIVVIDEADRSFGSGGDEGDGDGGTSSRVVARIKEFMSDTANRGRILFILMTNRPDKLDIDIKRAGRLDRKIPFLYPQTPEDVERVLEAQIRKHKLKTTLEFPRDREAVSARVLGYSNADFEAIALLANDLAAERGPDSPLSADDFAKAVRDYLPSRDLEMLEYMELLAVFEASNRRMLPPKYAALSVDELQKRLDQLRVVCAGRR
jgi:AAA+ superfamily predicted ATPase